MGLSSSKPQHRYSQTGHLVQGGYAYPPQGQGQFGYYIQQVGSEPTQVRAIPGYYYHPGQQGVTRGRTRPRKHNSVPALSNSFPLPPQPRGSAPPDAPPAASSAEEPATSTEPPAEPTSPSESAARPDALLEELPTADESTVPEQQQDAAVTLPPAPVQPELTNPLPSPPRDVLDSHAYRHLRRAQTSPTTGAWQYHTAPVASVSYKPHLRSQHRAKGTDTLRPPRPHDELIAKGAKSSGGGGGAFKLLRSLTMPVLSSNKTKKLRGSTPVSHSGSGYPYRSFTSSSRNTIPAFSAFPVAGPHVPSGRPITIPLNSPLNPTSRHKITYKRKEYPTAAHLFEAQKFLKHNPELAERIRMSDANAAEMSKLSRAFQTDGMVRGDWELVWRDKMDEVLYLKFTQHPNLQAELMATGYAPLLDGNEIRQPDAEGVNELGKALVRLRERLRRVGAR